MAHYDIYRDRLATTHATFGHALWQPCPEAASGPVKIGDVGYVREGKFYRLFNALLPSDDASHEGVPLPEYHVPLTPKVPGHISTDVLNPNNCCSVGVNVSPAEPEYRATVPPDYPQLSFSCSRRHGGAVLSLPVDSQRQDTRARGDFGKWMLQHIDSWFNFARGLGLGIDQMEEIILVTGCHHTRSWANIVFLENQTHAQASFGVNVTGGREARDIHIRWEYSLGDAQGAVCNLGPEGKNLPEDQCIFIRGFRIYRVLGIFPRQLRGAAGPNPSLGDDQDDKELGLMPAFTKTRDPLHVLLDYIVEQSPNCDMVVVHDDDLARIARYRNSDEIVERESLMAYLQMAQPEIHQSRYSFQPASEETPRNGMGPKTVAMSLEEFRTWNDRRDHNPPSLIDRCAEGGAETDCDIIGSVFPLPPYLNRQVSPGIALQRLFIPDVTVDTALQAPIRSQFPVPDLDRLRSFPSAYMPPESSPLGQLEVHDMSRRQQWGAGPDCYLTDQSDDSFRRIPGQGLNVNSSYSNDLQLPFPNPAYVSLQQSERMPVPFPRPPFAVTTPSHSMGSHKEGSSSKEHVCDCCNKRFARIQELRRHTRDKHKPRHRCPFCSFTWTRPLAMRRHLTDQHKNQFTEEEQRTISGLQDQVKMIRFIENSLKARSPGSDTPDARSPRLPSPSLEDILEPPGDALAWAGDV